MLGVLVLLLIIGSAISWIALNTSEKKLVSRLNSTHFRTMVVTGLIVLSILLTVISALVVNFAENKRKQSLEFNLNTLLTSTQERLKTWVKYELDSFKNVAKNQTLVSLVEELLTVPADATSLKNSPLQSQIRQFFKEQEGELSNLGFFVISPENINISSMRDTNIGFINIIQKTQPDLLQGVFEGKNTFVPPIRSDIHLQEAGSKNGANKPPTMFFSVPVINAQGKVIAAITKRINFDGLFSTILSAGFIGKSGEVYAIDKTGTLLSNVRYEDDLKKSA